jgi:hypothetical protein
MDNRHYAQAKSVATLYGLASPEEMFKHWPSVRLQAAKEMFPRPDDAILNPKEDRIT